MAEGLGKKILKNCETSSAGTVPEPVNPNAINALNEIGIDISNNKSKKIDVDKLNDFDLVITLCGDAKDQCPVISTGKHIHWDIKDPAKYMGNDEELINKYSKIRDIIINKINLLKEKI